MLRFRLFSIPVTVRPSFVVVSIVIGLSVARSWEARVAWVGVVFVSILVHELGHALTARSFGSQVQIELNAVGGLTSWSMPDRELGPGRRAVVAAAGSAVGVAFGGLVWLIAYSMRPLDGVAAFIASSLVFVNVFWGLLNWLPIRPLDGGHLLRSILQKVAPARADRIANVVFLVTAAGALAFSLWAGMVFITILSAWLLWIEISRGLPASRGMPPFSFDDEVTPGEGSDEEGPVDTEIEETDG